MQEDQKAPYETPVLIRHGTFEEVTQANSDGQRTDAAFPNDTPLSGFHFS